MKKVITLLSVSLMVSGPLTSGAVEMPAVHQQRGGEVSNTTPNQIGRECRSSVTGDVGQKGHAPSGTGQSDPVLFDGVQIETSDIKLYESFFATILHAPMVQHMDHPQVDSLRGYCYHGVLIVVRQDLRAQRPTGWVQINFSVPNVAAVQEDLEGAYRASPLYQREEVERAKTVRFRLKQDVRRGNCQATRLEVSGPEGFMVGFDQYKEGTCVVRREEGK